MSTANLKPGDNAIVVECDEKDEHQKWNFIDPAKA